MRGWKQAYTMGYETVVIVELEIPDDAKVKHISKCGLTKDFYVSDKAKVVSITSIDKEYNIESARSMKDPDFVYQIGAICHARRDISLGSREGIYYFDSRERAEKYEF